MFSNKTIVITGAAGGIGKELSKVFARQGAKIIAIDFNQTALRKLEDDLLKENLPIQTMHFDLLNLQGIPGLIETIRGEQTIHFWLNNAGTSRVDPFLDIDAEDFDRVMALNFQSPAAIMRCLIPKMEAQGTGTIVNIASVAGHIPSAWLSPYVASKHAMVGLTRAVRLDLALETSPVKMVLVSPGFVKTDMTQSSVHGHSFPSWLSWALSDPHDVALEILRGLKKNRDEITPTLNGKLMKLGSKFSMKRLSKSSKILLSTTFKDALLGRIKKN